MAPEAVMLLIDSSEYMRNGDFTPTRFEAQADAVSVIFSAKTGANPENTVGVMTMGGAGGKGPSVLVTPTNDLGKVLSAMHKATVGGTSDLETGIQVAQLALKHRQNKTQRQRIIILIGSPLENIEEKSLIKLGKKLKKNNVAVDVVTFTGEDDAAPSGETMAVEGGAGGAEATGFEGVLKRFVEAVGSGDNSHIISIPPGPHLLSDVIASSSILAGDEIPGGGDFGGGEASGSGGTGGGGGFEFGVDPEMDPELAMVLRMSMEEEQARQAAAAQTAASSSSSSEPLATVPESSSHPAAAASSAVVAPIAAPSAPVPKGAEPPLGADEDAELAAALALSSGGGVGNHGGDVEMGAEENDEDDEEEAIRQAIAMSMQEDQQKDGEKK